MRPLTLLTLTAAVALTGCAASHAATSPSTKTVTPAAAATSTAASSSSGGEAHLRFGQTFTEQQDGGPVVAITVQQPTATTSSYTASHGWQLVHVSIRSNVNGWTFPPSAMGHDLPFYLQGPDGTQYQPNLTADDQSDALNTDATINSGQTVAGSFMVDAPAGASVILVPGPEASPGSPLASWSGA